MGSQVFFLGNLLFLPNLIIDLAQLRGIILMKQYRIPCNVLLGDEVSQYWENLCQDKIRLDPITKKRIGLKRNYFT